MIPTNGSLLFHTLGIFLLVLYSFCSSSFSQSRNFTMFHSLLLHTNPGHLVDSYYFATQVPRIAHAL